jgi:translocator protein
MKVERALSRTPKVVARRHDVAGLLVFVIICLGVSVAGGAATASSVGTWYQALQKPPFNPPDWLFAPVWTALYIMMAVAGWRVWRAHGPRRARPALVLFGTQLALNLAWSFVFFGYRLIGAALFEIIVLLVAIVATTILFWKRDRLAAILLVPYAGWVAFATILNFALWQLN